jgi:hypothetical protein
MKFWELVSMFRDEDAVLLAVLREPQWALYLGWYNDYAKHASGRNQNVLDAEMPEELCRRAVRQSQKKFYIHDNYLYYYLSGVQTPAGISPMTALEAFEKFGGTALEEVLEKSSFYVGPGADVLMGDWYTAPGITPTVLHFSRDGTGSFRVVRINEETFDRFKWTYFTGKEIHFVGLDGPIKNEFLAQGGSFRFEIQRKVQPDGSSWDFLTLSIWHDAEVLEGGGRRIEYPAGWASFEFWRSVKTN